MSFSGCSPEQFREWIFNGYSTSEIFQMTESPHPYSIGCHQQ